MKKINFENLPLTNTPISAGNLNQMQSNIEESAVIVSPTEPTTSEKVWIQKGKNLFNKNNVTRDVMLEDDGSLTSYYNYYVSDYIPIQSGKTYTLGTTASTRNKFFKSDYTPYSTGRDVDAQYNANTFTVPDDVCFIRITIDLNECDINQVQLEQGTAATPYESYVEPKIYVKNDNGVYEEFINVEEIKAIQFVTNVECATNEYLDGKRVYAKRIYLGALPNNGSKTVKTGISWAYNIIKVDTIAPKSDRSSVIEVNRATASSFSSWYLNTTDFNEYIFVIQTTDDRSTYNGYATIYYIKS